MKACPKCGGELKPHPDKDYHYCTKCGVEYPTNSLIMDERDYWKPKSIKN